VVLVDEVLAVDLDHVAYRHLVGETAVNEGVGAV